MSAPTHLDRVEKALDTFGRTVFLTWWLWPAVLVAGGVIALSASLLAYPVAGDVHILGMDFMGACEFRTETGHPCASCGMTRSWVHVVRGQVWIALRYNVAGVVMWAAMVWGGIVGTLRLIRRQHTFLRLPVWVTLPLFAVWVIGIYAGSYLLRIGGYYPLETIEAEMAGPAQLDGEPSTPTSRTHAE